MACGLSELQKWILAQAGRRGRIYYTDICEGYFGWQPVRPIERYGETRQRYVMGTWVEETVPPEKIGQIVVPAASIFPGSK